MGTVLQKRLAENIVKNVKRKKPLNKTKLLVESGYSVVSAKASATMLIDKPGVQEELANLGFTTEGAKGVVETIMYDKRVKPETRINAAKEVFKVTGGYAPVTSVTAHIDIEVPERIKALASKLNAPT